VTKLGLNDPFIARALFGKEIRLPDGYTPLSSAGLSEAKARIVQFYGITTTSLTADPLE
jgi:hypothetical protein